MPVILELEDYEASQVVDALVEQRIRLMKNWENRYRSPDENDGRYGIDIGKIGDLAMIDANIGTVYALRERLKDGIMVQRMCQEHALYPEKSVSVAWHHKRGWLPTADFVEKPIEDDQMSPGKWTTLPDEVDPDGWMFDITDPDDKIVIASADTQTDGTTVGFHTFPTEADNAVSKGIWALITRNFSLASARDMKLAEKALKADPKRLAVIKSSIEGLQRAFAQDDEDTWPIDPILGSWTSRLDPANADRIDISFNGAPRYRAIVQKSISTALLEDILQAVPASIARLDNE